MESSQDLTKVTENIDLALTWLTFLKVTENIQQKSRKMHWIYDLAQVMELLT